MLSLVMEVMLIRIVVRRAGHIGIDPELALIFSPAPSVRFEGHP